MIRYLKKTVLVKKRSFSTFEDINSIFYIFELQLWSTYCDEGYYCAVYSKCCARGCCIFSRNGVSFHQAGVGIIFIVIFVVILACLCVSARPVPLTPWFTHRSTPYPSTQSITQSFLNLFVRPPPYSEVVARDDVEAPPPYSEVCENPDRYPVIVALPPNNNIGSKIRRGLSKSCSIGRLKNQNRFFSNAYNTNEILYVI